MITLIKYGALGGGEKYNANIMYIDGLSGDTKPTGTFEGTPIPNASVYTEIDTGKEYTYDSVGTQWYETTTSGGGGGGGTTNYAALSNKPQINGTTLSGNKTSADLGLQGALTQTQLGAVNSGVTANSVNVLEDILDSGEKNIIFNGYQSYTSGSFTCTVNANGSITLNGTVPNSMSFLFTNLFTGAKTIDGAYDNVLHFPQGNYRVAKSSRESDVYLQIIAYNTSSSVAALSLTDVGDGSKSFTVDNTYSYNFARIRIIAGKSFSNFTFMPFVCTEDAWLVSKTVTPYRMTTDEITSALNGKQNTIDSSHKLSADNVDDTNTTNKFATAAELAQIDTNKNNILNNANDIIDYANSDSDIVKKSNISDMGWWNAIPNATTGVPAEINTRICTRKIKVGNTSTITVEFDSTNYKLAWYLYKEDTFFDKKYWITSSPCIIATAGMTEIIIGLAKSDDSSISPSAVSNITSITPVSLSATKNYNGKSIHFEVGTLMSQNGLPLADNKRIRSEFIFLPKGSIINNSNAPKSLIVYEYERDKETMRSNSSWDDGDFYVMSADGFCRILARKNSTNPTISDSEVAELSSYISIIPSYPMDILTTDFSGNYSPSYYNMDTKSASIDSNMCAVGVNGITFAFCTDLHWESNWKRIPSLLADVKERNKAIDYMLVGGDIINGGVKSTAVSNMKDCIDSIYAAGFLPICVRGNHDNNSIPSGNTLISDSEFYAICQSRCPNSTVYGDYAYFYYDDTKTKTRFICLDSGAEGTALSSAQSTWLSSALQSTPSGWHIIVTYHIVYGLASGTWEDIPLDLAPTSFSSSVFTILDSHNSTADSTVEAIIGGHVHSDHNYETTGGIPIVLTDTAGTRALDGGSATRFTVTETAFDVITIDYTNKSIKCVRIGRGSDRTISYV